MSVLTAVAFILLTPFLSVGNFGNQEPARYFGQTPPSDTPSVFAPGIISMEDRFEQFLLYSPDGRELTFGVTNSDWSAFSLSYLELHDGEWTEPVAAPFLAGDTNAALTAAFSFERGPVFFTAARPTYPPADVWVSERTRAGWSDPTRVGPPISSDADEFEVAIARNGTLYFSSSREGGMGDLDIYRARPVSGAYAVAENLGPPVNTPSGDDLPFIAVDESYLIFASDRPGGFGERDLYISFQTADGWTEPVNLGSPINSAFWDIYPSISPDGKYLFFTRRTSWQATEDSDIYWVSAAFVDRLRNSMHAR